MTLRVIVADDEPLVRERVATLLASRPDCTLVAECADGASALCTIQDEQPDVALLDVQMPELDGFEVVDALAPDERPAVIFITAYDEYAVRAFAINAVDYLLKPLEPARFHEALDRVRSRHGEPAPPPVQPEVTALLRELRALRGYGDRLVVRDAQRVSFVRVEDVDWIEAVGNYVRLHLGAETRLMREPLKSLAARLDADRFVRIHRSIIVNVDRIAHMEPHFHGEYRLTLRDGKRLTSSRSYSEGVRALLR